MSSVLSGDDAGRAAMSPPSQALKRFTAPLSGLNSGGPDRPGADTLRYGVRIGAVGLLIKRDAPSEVVDARSITPMPNAPPWFVGLMNLRGNAVPVFDLWSALDLSRNDESQKTMVLVLDKGEKAVGVLIDGLPRVLTDWRRTTVPDSLPARLTQHASFAMTAQGTLWLEFEHDSFFQSLCEAAAV